MTDNEKILLARLRNSNASINDAVLDPRVPKDRREELNREYQSNMGAIALVTMREEVKQ